MAASFLGVRLLSRNHVLSAFPTHPGDEGITALSAAMHGVAYGLLHVVGPDHLGTLMSLSVSSSPRRAFWLGATWSMGHCAGMVAIGFVLVALEKATHLNMELWEHVGDYFVGVSMCLCGWYFLFSEQRYVEERDGFESLRGCDCCHHPAAASARDPRLPPSRAVAPERRLNLSRDFARGANGQKACCDNYGTCTHAVSKQDDDRLPRSTGIAPGSPTAGSTAGSPTWSPRSPMGPEPRTMKLSDCGAAFLGVAQGMCCPMGLVGVAFLASMPPSRVAIFLVVFLLVSCAGTGGFSFLWSALAGAHTQAEHAGSTWARTMYRGSCCFTVALGLFWIVANAFDVLDHWDFSHPHGHLDAITAAASA